MPDAIGTSNLPGDNMSPEAIDTAATNIRFIGAEVSTQGVSVVDAWQKLSGSYQAPESGDLLAAMGPVKTDAATFGRLLGKAATALETFADEVRAIKVTVAAIRTELNQFLADIKDGVEKSVVVARGVGTGTKTVPWDEDPASVAKNKQFDAQLRAQQVLLWQAERRCANAIYDLTGHAHIEAASAANCGQGYGVDEIPASAKMPWGSAVDRTERCGEKAVESVWHFAWDGVVVGFGGGTVQGVGALLGAEIPSWKVWDWGWSWGTMGGAWKGLGMTVVGVASIGLAGQALSKTDGPVGSFIRDSRKALKDTGKGIIAADKWGEDPAAAAGETTANILALIIPVGVAASSARAGGVAAKAGSSAAALRTAGKVVDATDPIYLAAQAARFAGKGAGLSVDALRGLLKTTDLTDSLDLNLDVGRLDVVPSVSREQVSVDQSTSRTSTSDAPPARDYGDSSEGGQRHRDTSDQQARAQEPAFTGGGHQESGSPSRPDGSSTNGSQGATPSSGSHSGGQDGPSQGSPSPAETTGRGENAAPGLGASQTDAPPTRTPDAAETSSSSPAEAAAPGAARTDAPPTRTPDAPATSANSPAEAAAPGATRTDAPPTRTQDGPSTGSSSSSPAESARPGATHTDAPPPRTQDGTSTGSTSHPAAETTGQASHDPATGQGAGDATAQPDVTDPATRADTAPGTGQGETPVRPPTPINDPHLLKSDPIVQAQLDTIRSQIGPELQKQADLAWAHAEARATAEGLALTPQRVGTFAHTELARWLRADGARLIDASSGYRIRPEIGFNAKGIEDVGRGTIRPDIIIERRVIDEAARLLDANTTRTTWQVVHVIDLKTGKAGIGSTWESAAQARLKLLGPSETLRPVK